AAELERRVLQGRADGGAAVRLHADRPVRRRHDDLAVGLPRAVRADPLHAAGVRDRQVRLLAQPEAQSQARRLMEVRYLTVGMAQENTWIARRDGSDTGLLIDPGDEPDRIKAALADLGVTKVEEILLTHCHFHPAGAVAPMAEATGAPVYCPKLEVPLLADIMAWVPWPGIGPFES